MRAGVHLTVICNRIRWLLMTPSGSVMAGIKALIPARTSASQAYPAHGSTQANPATDGLTTGLHGGHPGSRWASCTSLNREPWRGRETDVCPLWETSPANTEVKNDWGRRWARWRKDSGIPGRSGETDGSASVCNLYADLKHVPFWPHERLKSNATSNNIESMGEKINAMKVRDVFKDDMKWHS